MAHSVVTAVRSGEVRVTFTDRSDGDFAVALPDAELRPRRSAVADTPWTWFRQVHGDRVLTVEESGAHAGAEADGALTTVGGCPIAIMTADCAPVVLVADNGFAVVHAGWRGLAAGIVERAADGLRAAGASPVASLVGPCINPEAYEFGADDLDTVADLLGDEVRSQTSWGTPALDVPAAVAAACERAGWPRPQGRPPCTSDDRWFSHRTRAEAGRQATVAWLVTDAGEEGPAVSSEGSR